MPASTGSAPVQVTVLSSNANPSTGDPSGASALNIGGPGAVDRVADEAAAVATGARRVGRGDGLGERVGAAALDERDDGAAEAAAGHARGRRAFGVRQLDEQVELARRHLEVVAEAFVPGPEQLAEPVEVGAAGVFERGDAGANAVVLGD